MLISRRSFLGVLSATSLAGAGEHFAWARRPQESMGQAQAFAYVASEAPHQQGIQVLLAGTNRWRPLQFVPTRSPAALALSPDGQTLFVANRVQSVAGWPTGSVESFCIHTHTGRLTRLSTQRLALSATGPGHLAVSPDGRSLAVACTGGGSFNVVPIAEDGSLLPVRLLRKELGCGAHPERQNRSYPRQVLFTTGGQLLGADYGTDRLSLFDPGEDSLHLQDHIQLSAGSGPTCMTFDRHRTTLCVANELQRQVITFRNGTGDRDLPTQPASVVNRADDAVCTALHAHPDADLLLGAWTNGQASSLTSWAIHPPSGRLQAVDEIALPGAAVHLAFTGGSDTFVALCAGVNKVFRFECSGATGRFTRAYAVAKALTPSAVVLRPRGVL